MDQPNELIARALPNDQDAELAVLAACVLDRDAISAAGELLLPDDFYRADYKAVYAAMLELHSNGKPIDLITIKNKLEERKLFEQVGGRDMLMKLAGYSSTAANIMHHARIIADRAILRRLISASGEISQKSYDSSKSVDEVTDFAEKAIFDISQRRNSQSFTSIRELVSGAVAELERLSKSGGKLTGVETGFDDLDNLTSGLQPSDLILIAARPSMGKTALAVNIAQNAAKKGVTAAVFSLEMSKEQLTQRMLCTEALVDSRKLRVGDLDAKDWENIAEAVGTLSSIQLFIDDTPGIGVSELRAKCRKLKLEKDLGLIVIDYIQLMSGITRTDNRQQEVSEISRSLKAIARELHVPVVVLSQLSRKNESRADHRPMLSDLRDSGAIEQDADIVAFVYREDYYKPDTDKKGIAELIVAKHRNGATETIELIFRKEYTKFASIAR